MTAYPVSNGRREPWAIKDSRGRYIAYVEWYQPWGKYVMNAESNAIFSDDCLMALSKFCAKLSHGVGMESRKGYFRGGEGYSSIS